MHNTHSHFPLTPAVLGILLAAAGCVFAQGRVSPGPAAEAGQQSAAQPASQQAAVNTTSPNYRLSANDLIFIKVYEEDDLNSTLRVGEDGKVMFPLIGSVNVGGETVEAATRTIRELLDAKYLVNPQVTLTVLAYANRHITVLGQVQKPGDYNLREQGTVSLLQAVGMAGGFTRLANSANIIVKRTVGGEEKILRLDGKSMASNKHTSPFQVLPGDTITVSERFF